MLTSYVVKIEKYQVMGLRDGYRILRGAVLDHWHKSPAKEGNHDAFTNAQRGVTWLKNQRLVNEYAGWKQVALSRLPRRDAAAAAPARRLPPGWPGPRAGPVTLAR